MKTLLIMRHAKSSWDDPNLSDHDRPLNPRGLKAAPRMGEMIKTRGPMPDLIICSSAKRARETMTLLVEASGYDKEIVQEPNLYGVNSSGYLKILKGHARDHDCVMTVGHNPTCEELLINLTNEHHPFPTATIAEIKLDIEGWDELSFNSEKAELKHIWRPKEID